MFGSIYVKKCASFLEHYNLCGLPRTKNRFLNCSRFLCYLPTTTNVPPDLLVRMKVSSYSWIMQRYRQVKSSVGVFVSPYMTILYPMLQQKHDNFLLQIFKIRIMSAIFLYHDQYQRASRYTGQIFTRISFRSAFKLD